MGGVGGGVGVASRGVPAGAWAERTDGVELALGRRAVAAAGAASPSPDGELEVEEPLPQAVTSRSISPEVQMPHPVRPASVRGPLYPAMMAIVVRIAFGLLRIGRTNVDVCCEVVAMRSSAGQEEWCWPMHHAITPFRSPEPAPCGSRSAANSAETPPPPLDQTACPID